MPDQVSTLDTFYRDRRVLVTGGFGFMGLNLVRALREADAHVSVLSRSWPPAQAGVDHMLDGIEFHKGDIRDAPLVEEAITGNNLIFHLAGMSGPVASNTSPLEDLDVNGRGALTLLEECRRTNPEAKVVFPSSRLVYAPTAELPVPESAPTGSQSVYGIHKLSGEGYLLLYQRLHGLRASVLRITNPYGPFQRPEQNRYGVINWFIHEAMHDRALTVYGDGRQLRDYVHINDVVRALMLAGARAEADGRIFNVGSGSGVSFLSMAELIVEKAGAGTVQHIEWPADAAKVETGDFVADVSSIEAKLGWKATVDFESGIEDVIAKYRELAGAWL